MTMDHEVVESGCKNCNVLRNEIDKRTVQWENNNAHQLAGFLTLKQKIISTDKLIREYQSSKVECDILTRKNEEFVHLIDQLHRDLSTRNQEYGKLYGSNELLKKANADYEVKFKELHDEAEKWKSQTEAGEIFTSQLIEKVKVLEKYEEEVKHTASVSRECEKMERKVIVMKGQLKEAKEATNKSKKEICKLQREYNLLVKYAKQWGKIIEAQGKFNSYQQKFYSKLCNGDDKGCLDVDQDVIDANETDEQSKLLEQLLGEPDGSDSIMGPPDILSSDTEVSKGNLSSLSKSRQQSPGKSLPDKQVKQTRTSAERRSSRDSTTPSESPDKTPIYSSMERKRTRKASQNSVTPSSDADTATESEKEKNKRSGPRTRSRAVKITAIPNLKGPDSVLKPDSTNVIAEQALPELITDIPHQPRKEIANILELDTIIADPMVVNRKKHIGCLSSSESESELKLPTKSPKDVAVPNPSTPSILGVIPLTNIFESNEFDDPKKQQNCETRASKMDQDFVQSHSQFRTAIPCSSLLGFGFDSSSDSDIEMMSVPNCKLQASLSKQDQSVLTVGNSLKTTFSGIFDKSQGSSGEKLTCDSVSVVDKSCSNTNRVSCSIFELEEDLDMSSSDSEDDAIKSNQETVLNSPKTDVAVQPSLSLNEDHISAVPESVIIREIGAVPNVGATDSEVPVGEVNPESDTQFCDEKTVDESSRYDSHGNQEETSKQANKCDIISLTKTEMPRSLEENAKSMAVTENEREAQDGTIVNESETIQKEIQTNPFDMTFINTSAVQSEAPTQLPQSLDLQPNVVEDQNKKNFQEAPQVIPGRLQVELSKMVDSSADGASTLETKRSKELEENNYPLLTVAEHKSENKLESDAIVVIPEQLQDQLSTDPVEISNDVALLVDNLPIHPEMLKQLEENHDTQPTVIENKSKKVLQHETVLALSRKKENLQTKPVDSSSIDTEGSKSFSNQEIEEMFVDFENEKEFQNVSVVFSENVPMVLESDSVNPLSVDAMLVESKKQKQFEQIQGLHPNVVIVEDNDPKKFQKEALFIVNAEKLQEHLEIEAVDTRQVETRVAEQVEDTLEAEPMVVDNNLSGLPSVPFEKNIESVNASSDEECPIEDEMPEPSEGNQKFLSPENHPEESQIEQANNSLILESGNEQKIVKDQNETEPMTVGEKTDGLEESQASSPKPEEESKCDTVNKFSGTESQTEIQETKSTKENPNGDLVMEIITEKPVPNDELVVASSEKLGQIPSEYVGFFSSNLFPVEVSEKKPMENQNRDSETIVIDDKIEKEIGDEDVTVPLYNIPEDKTTNVTEVSNTNLQVEIEVAEPFENQEIQGMLSGKHDGVISSKPQEDQLKTGERGVGFSAKNLLLETGLATFKRDDQEFVEATVGGKCAKNLLDSEVAEPVGMLQGGSMPNVTEALLQVEKEVPKPSKANQGSLITVSDQSAKLLLLEVKDYSDKLQQDQPSVTDVDDSAKNMKDHSMPKVAESFLQVEKEVPQPKENNQESLATVSDQREKELPHEVEDFLDKPQQDQPSVTDVDNRVEMMKDDSMPNVAESLLLIEMGVPKLMENNQESLAIVSDQPAQELLHKDEDSLDKTQDQQSIAVVDNREEIIKDCFMPNVAETLLQVEPKVPELVKDNQESLATVSDQHEKELPHEVENFLEKSKQDQQLIADVDNREEMMQDNFMANVAESSLQVETEVPEPMEDNQESLVTVSKQPEKELPQQDQPSVAEFDYQVKMKQGDSMPNIAESSLQVETEVLKSIEDNQESQATFVGQAEKESLCEVEGSQPNLMVDVVGPKKGNQDFEVTESSNSEAVDPADTMQEEFQTNVDEPSDKNSPSEFESLVPKSTKHREFEVVKSPNNSPPIEVEMEAKTETESIFVNRITESRREMDTPLDKQGVQSMSVNDPYSEESTTEVDVEPETISVFEAVRESPIIPPMEETTYRASPQLLRQSISDKILESSKPPEENPKVDNSPQSGATKLKSGQHTLPITNNLQVTRDAHLSPFNPLAIPTSVFIERNSNRTMGSSDFTKVSQTLEASAFKVPRVPNTPPRVPDVNLHSNFSRSKGVPHGVKRTSVDDEVAILMKQIRTNIIELPLTVSPLPKSPEPQPIAPKKIAEPKSLFPVLPRCAFNWTGKKLPISDRLTERFGGFLHPGVQVRVRFRKVGRRLRDIRPPDILSHCFQGVTNFAEAERRLKPALSSVPFVEDIANPDLVEPEKKLPEAIPENPRPLITTKAKVSTPVSRPKAVPDLFGSDSSSSESECESDAVSSSKKERLSRPLTFPAPIPERLTRPLAFKNLKEKQSDPGTSCGSKPSPNLFNSSRAQILGQLVEPIIPLGRGHRSDSFLPAKQNELRRDLESPTTDQTRYRLGLGKGVRKSQHTISPCSESLLSVVSKAKTPVNRVVAPLKRSLQQPEVPITPVVTTPDLSENSSPLTESSFKKRVSHTLKRGLEPDPAAPIVSPASKRGRTVPENTPPAPSPQSPVADKVESQEVPISARTRQKSKNFCPAKPQELVKLDSRNVPSGNQKLKQKTFEKSPNATRRFKRSAIETSASDSETENMEVNTEETGQSSSSERDERILKPNEEDSYDSSNENRSPPQLPNNPQSTQMGKSSELSEIDESLELPDESSEPPSYVETNESPKSPDVDESPKSPDEKLLDDHENMCSKTVVEIPTQSEHHQPSAFELVYKDLLETSPVQPRHKQAKGTTKLRKEINFAMTKFFRDPEVIDEFLNSLIERVMRSDSLNTPSIFIQLLVTKIIRGCNDPIDSSNTPPAPPMAVVHQRCVILLQKLDESNSEIQVEPNVDKNMFSDLFLSESSAVMFQSDSSLTLEEMCSLSRAYTAVCRSRGSLAKARAFLFDCVYFVPPRSYALAYTVMSIWADVLRQVSFPLGLSCVDQTIAFVLLHNCKVKAVPGISGKVIQTRSFLQNTYEYKKTTRTVDDLVDHLMTRFYETNSPDEASSLSWSLALLARWEGVDFAIQLIEKKLWPFLQRWSSGESTNNSAAAVIITIGMLGKTVPASKRAGVKSVLDAMKVLLQADGVVPPIQEAAIEAVIHLGESDDPKSIIEIVKGWKIMNTCLSQHMRRVLKAFLKRHSNLCVV